MDKIIRLMKGEERYKQMWKEFIVGMAHINVRSYPKKYEDTTNMDCVNELIKHIEQKYFPQPITKILQIEIEAEKEKRVDAIIANIKDYVNNNLVGLGDDKPKYIIKEENNVRINSD